MSSEPTIAARGLRKCYGEGAGMTAVLCDLDLELAAGEFAVILGRSGSGKSTLLNLLGAMDAPSGGALRVAGQDLAALDERGRSRFRRHRLGFVFQAYNLLPTLTVAENLALPLVLNARPASARVRDLMTALGLDGKGDRYPDELSGGEQQRVAIARAVIHEPPVVLADEPTGNLDADTAAQVLEVLVRLVRERGTTLVMATHSAEPLRYADRALRLDHGRLVAAATD